MKTTARDYLPTERHIAKNSLRKLVFNLADAHERAIPMFHDNARILDFGCGDCKLFDRIKHLKNTKLIGYDLDPQRVKIARDKGYKVYTALNSIKGEFDFIIANEVIEYLSREEIFNMFKKAEELLTKDGKLIISTLNPREFYANIHTWDNWGHTRPYSIEALRQLGKQLNLKAVKIEKHHIRVNPLKLLLNFVLGLDIHSGFMIVFQREQPVC